jgi:hypothetical protein
MSETSTTKSKASKSDRLTYLEFISTALIGLQNAIKNLELRRAFADLDETREINIKISEYQAVMVKLTAARNLYLAQDVTFTPPSQAELDAAKQVVDKLDSIIVANEKATAIIESVTNLITTFEKTQGA